ncbi:hypothetical protein BJY52DRAFT_824380 [Lactarius psammicola]|nr:hypothetical protein BJY52DRAFT_824380 [Lactarius psammicola]
MPAPLLFLWILRCSHDYTCFVSLLFVWHDFTTLFYCLPSHCSCLSHPPRAALLFFSTTIIITLSAHPFADILDINTSRDPRVTSLALIVVRLQLCTIPLFLRRHSTLLIMFASCQHYETIC